MIISVPVCCFNLPSPDTGDWLDTLTHTQTEAGLTGSLSMSPRSYKRPCGQYVCVCVCVFGDTEQSHECGCVFVCVCLMVVYSKYFYSSDHLGFLSESPAVSTTPAPGKEREREIETTASWSETNTPSGFSLVWNEKVSLIKHSELCGPSPDQPSQLLIWRTSVINQLPRKQIGGLAHSSSRARVPWCP